MRARFLSVSILVLIIFPSIVSVRGDTAVSVKVLPDMPHPRFNHTAVLIEGRLYVMGGTEDGTTSLVASEVLDLETFEWTRLPNMSLPRMRHTANYLKGPGRLMIVGGFQGRGHPSLIRHFGGQGNHSLSSCEFFDLKDERFMEAPSLKIGRFWHGAHVLPNGSLLVIGGLNVSHGALSSCEIFDGSSWSDFPPLPIPLARFASCVYPDGSILVAGGHNGTVKVGSRRSFLFDTGEGTWKETAPMNEGRGFPGYCLIPDTGFMVSGGFSRPGMNDHSSTEIYHRETDRWSMTGNMSFPRHAHGSILTGDDDVLVAGGSNCETGMCHSGMEIFDPETNQWRDAGGFIVARKWGTVTSTEDGDAVVIGGKACNYATGRSEMVIFADTSPGGSETDIGVLCLGLMFLSIFMALPAVLVWKMVRSGGFG